MKRTKLGGEYMDYLMEENQSNETSTFGICFCNGCVGDCKGGCKGCKSACSGCYGGCKGGQK